MLYKTLSAAVYGVEASIIEVEVDVSGMKLLEDRFHTVGLPDATVRESRDRVRAALKNCGFDIPFTHITINLAPADIRKEGSGFDLPMALGILGAFGGLNKKELADAVGIKAQVAAITERAMNGELDFAPALNTRVALLMGIERATVEAVRRERITLTPGGRALVSTMKAYGAYTALVSGGFTIFADFFARRIGFDEATANTLQFDGEVLSGTVALPIVDKTTKLSRLKALAAERGLAMADTLAVGDGANDLEMIRASGLGVAFRAKPAVAAEADARVDFGDLTALLYLQGYTDEEIVR